MKLKATVTLIAEFEVNTDHYGCAVDKIPDFEKAELTIDPTIMVDLPGCQTFVKVEEIK